MKKEVVDKLAALITAAFGLVAALAWNGAITGVFDRVYGAADGLVAKVVYAFLVTVLAVVVTLWVGKLAHKVK